MRKCLAYVLAAATGAVAVAVAVDLPHGSVGGSLPTVAESKVYNNNNILPSAAAAFKWAREHVIPPQATCGWTRSTYVDGVWAYYAATAAAGHADADARNDLMQWGEELNYSLCDENGAGGS